MLLPGVRGLSFAPSVLLFRFRVGVEKAGSGRRGLNPLPPPWGGGALAW